MNAARRDGPWTGPPELTTSAAGTGMADGGAAGAAVGAGAGSASSDPMNR
jgi:hypothetical protein